MDIQSLFSVSGKNVLITGGASGIGRMMAEGFCANGANVVIASRKILACEAAANEINAAYPQCNCTPYQADVAIPDDIARLAKFLESHFSSLHVLINNAGKTWGAPFESFPPEEWSSVFAVNVTAPFLLAQKLRKQLSYGSEASAPSRILNIGSVVGLKPVSNDAFSYGTSKAAVHHLTQILANELAIDNITVNALAPGAFPSQMMKYATQDQDAKRAIIAKTPMLRLGQPQDIAGAAIYLCSPAGAFITGAVIPVDGGVSVAI